MGTRWRNLANTIEPSVCSGDAALCQIIFTTYLIMLISDSYTALLDVAQTGALTNSLISISVLPVGVSQAAYSPVTNCR